LKDASDEMHHLASLVWGRMLACQSDAAWRGMRWVSTTMNPCVCHIASGSARRGPRRRSSVTCWDWVRRSPCRRSSMTAVPRGQRSVPRRMLRSVSGRSRRTTMSRKRRGMLSPESTGRAKLAGSAQSVRCGEDFWRGIISHRTRWGRSVADQLTTARWFVPAQAGRTLAGKQRINLLTGAPTRGLNGGGESPGSACSPALAA
jgi:hypothetical protein